MLLLWGLGKRFGMLYQSMINNTLKLSKEAGEVWNEAGIQVLASTFIYHVVVLSFQQSTKSSIANYEGTNFSFVSTN